MNAAIATAKANTISTVTIRSRGAVPITRPRRARILRGHGGRRSAPSGDSRLPQALQNAAPASLRCPQLGQNTGATVAIGIQRRRSGEHELIAVHGFLGGVRQHLV